MKLWKCEPYLLVNKGFVLVVVMAETRQQAIEKAIARLLAGAEVAPIDVFAQSISR